MPLLFNSHYYKLQQELIECVEKAKTSEEVLQIKKVVEVPKKKDNTLHLAADNAEVAAAAAGLTSPPVNAEKLARDEFENSDGEFDFKLVIHHFYSNMENINIR